MAAPFQLPAELQSRAASTLCTDPLLLRSVNQAASRAGFAPGRPGGAVALACKGPLNARLATGVGLSFFLSRAGRKRYYEANR
jgi:hypothetical protein